MIFTFLMWLCTLKSTLAFSSLFFMVWVTFLMLALAYYRAAELGAPSEPLLRAGGAFGIVAAFIAWWNMIGGLLDHSNSFFLIPVFHFPWSEKGREMKAEKADNEKGQLNGESV